VGVDAPYALTHSQGPILQLQAVTMRVEQSASVMLAVLGYILSQCISPGLSSDTGRTVQARNG
jgi:hypothetical protein